MKSQLKFLNRNRLNQRRNLQQSQFQQQNPSQREQQQLQKQRQKNRQIDSPQHWIRDIRGAAIAVSTRFRFQIRLNY